MLVFKQSELHLVSAKRSSSSLYISVVLFSIRAFYSMETLDLIYLMTCLSGFQGNLNFNLWGVQSTVAAALVLQMFLSFLVLSMRIP